MKMPQLLRRDAAPVLTKTRSQLAALEARIVQLASDRATKLAEIDDLEVLKTIDKQIAAARGEVELLRERIDVLEQQAREGAAYAFSGERKFRHTLAIARPVTMALEATTRLWRDSARTELLGSAVKVTDQQYPRVYHAARAACGSRDIEQGGDLLEDVRDLGLVHSPEQKPKAHRHKGFEACRSRPIGFSLPRWPSPTRARSISATPTPPASSFSPTRRRSATRPTRRR